MRLTRSFGHSGYRILRECAAAETSFVPGGEKKNLDIRKGRTPRTSQVGDSVGQREFQVHPAHEDSYESLTDRHGGGKDLHKDLYGRQNGTSVFGWEVHPVDAAAASSVGKSADIPPVPKSRHKQEYRAPLVQGVPAKEFGGKEGICGWHFRACVADLGRNCVHGIARRGASGPRAHWPPGVGILVGLR